MVEFKFELGQKVRDMVTGYVGTIISRVEYMNGYIRYGLADNLLYVDEDQLELVSEPSTNRD